MKIAVAGAGTAGLTAAIFLSRRGHDVTVYEAVAKADPVGAGFLIQPTGQSVLGDLGILAELRQKGAAVETLEGFRGTLRPLYLRYRDLDAEFCGLGLHRANLQKALIVCAKRAQVKLAFNRPVSAFGQSLSRDAITLVTGGKTVSADLLIIADGTRSHLRPLLPVRQQSRPYPWGAFWLICESDSWPHRQILLQKYGEPWTTVGVLPTGKHPQTGKTCYSIFWSIHRRDFDRYRLNGLALLEEKLRRFWPEAHTLFLNSRHSNWSVAEYADTKMAACHHGRVVVLGDAAHSMSPQLGQGANLALVDAKILAECLTRHTDTARALGDYSRLRKPHLRFYRLASRAMTPLYQSYLPLGVFRDAGTFLFRKIPPLYRQMLLMLSGYKGFTEKG